MTVPVLTTTIVCAHSKRKHGRATAYNFGGPRWVCSECRRLVRVVFPC